MKTNCATFKIETICDCLHFGYNPIGVSLTMETKFNEIYTKPTITTIFCSSSYYNPAKWSTIHVNDNPFRMIDNGGLLEVNII